jgi:hypothetical protein
MAAGGLNTALANACLSQEVTNGYFPFNWGQHVSLGSF